MFGSTPLPVLEGLKTFRYDYYLLMDIDLPWEDDPLRDFPDKREHFMEVWHRELQSLGGRYTVISGIGEERIQRALAAVRRFLRGS